MGECSWPGAERRRRSGSPAPMCSIPSDRPRLVEGGPARRGQDGSEHRRIARRPRSHRRRLLRDGRRVWVCVPDEWARGASRDAALGNCGGPARRPTTSKFRRTAMPSQLPNCSIRKPGEWTPTGSLSYARAGAPAVTLSDGRVLIVGTGEDTLERRRARGLDDGGDLRPGLRDLRACGLICPRSTRTASAISASTCATVTWAPATLGSSSRCRMVVRCWSAATTGPSMNADVLQSIRFDPARATWLESGSPCAADDYNDGDGCAGHLRRASSAGSSQGWMAAA